MYEELETVQEGTCTESEESCLVTINKTTYVEMQNRLSWLSCLEAAGVDNWEGYEYAQELSNEEARDE